MHALLAPTLAAFGCIGPQSAAPGVELRFAPAPDSQVRRTITLDHTLVVQEMQTTTRGTTQSSQENVSLSAHELLRTLDRYRSVADGRPLLLQRRFDEVAWNAEFSAASAPEKIKAVSPLAGTSVVYTWVPEEQAYGKYYDARESPEEVLLRLSEDLDLRALLPGHALQPGESWKVPADKLVDVFAPCGRLDLRFDAKRWRKNLLRTLRCGIAGNYGEYFGGESSGGCTLTLASVNSAKDAHRAEVDLALEFEQTIDQRGLLQAQMTGPEIASGYKCLRAPVSWSFTGKGHLVWDLDANRAASLDIDGTQKISIEFELAVGEQPPITQRMSFSGGLHFRWLIEDPAKAVAPPPAPPVEPPK